MYNKIKVLEKFEKNDWITKSGDKIMIKNLKLDHLKNIVKHLKKKYNAIEDTMNDFPSFQGEMAQDEGIRCWENEVERYNRLKRTLQLFEAYYKLKNL